MSGTKKDAAKEASSDPSMDDILASIRRILDEEEARPPVAVEPDEDDVLELEPSMIVPEPDEQAAGPVPSPPPILSEPAPMPVAAPVPVPAPIPAPIPVPILAPVPVPVPASVPAPLPSPAELPPLMAPEAAAAAADSVSALMRTLATERSTAVHRGGPTLEDLVRQEMRPLLKEWLDTHLAPVVERLVRAEIERVVNRT